MLLSVLFCLGLAMVHALPRYGYTSQVSLNKLLSVNLELASLSDLPAPQVSLNKLLSVNLELASLTDLPAPQVSLLTYIPFC